MKGSSLLLIKLIDQSRSFLKDFVFFQFSFETKFYFSKIFLPEKENFEIFLKIGKEFE